MKTGLLKPVFALLCLLLSAPTLAAPAAPLEIVLRQPDGSTFIAIPRGDEYSSWTETRDGYTIVRENSTWYYAERDAQGRLRATAFPVGRLDADQLRALPRHLAPAPETPYPETQGVRRLPRADAGAGEGLAAGAPLAYAQNVLTLLVDYSDTPFSYTDASFQNLMYGASGTVREFFLENSYDRFVVTPAAESFGIANDGIVHVARPVAHPSPGRSFAVSQSEARAIVALADPYVNFAAFDSDANGSISAAELSIVIILAGYETSYGGEAFALTPNVWGHKSGFETLSLDGKSLSPYTMFGEAHATEPANKHQATIGIMCHELGHLMLSLPDLYDTNGGSEGIGAWGLMGGGSWNAAAGYSGTSPSHLVAWSKIATGFTIPSDVLAGEVNANFASAHASERASRLWIDPYRVFEYFLVENRQKSGFDAGLPGAGLLVWHVDDRQRSNADETRKWVDLEEADGKTDLDDLVNRGDTGDPFPGASNNTTFDDASTPAARGYDGLATGIGVTGISASAATMTADLTPRSGMRGHVRYDESGPTSAFGYGSTTAWAGVRVLNDTGFQFLDGIDLFVTDGVAATVNVYFYESLAGGMPQTLLYSETGLAATPGWNRLLFSTPQPFPAAAERGVIVRIVNATYTFPIAVDVFGPDSGRSYIDFDGSGAFAPIDDVNLVALFGADETPPTATDVTPATLGPTNADSISFDISFSENVVNFDDAADLVIAHTSTAHGGISISGSGASYTVSVNGITGDGSFTLAVSTASDVEDQAGLALTTSVTSDAVLIDNTAPTVTIGNPSAVATATGPVSFAVTYGGADAVTLTPGDVTLNRTGTADGSVAVSGAGQAARTVTIDSITGNGTLGISLAGATASDSAGNPAASAGPSAVFAVDTTGPEATVITPDTAGPTNADSISFDVTFSEAVVNFNDAADLSISHSGTSHASSLVTGSGANYSVELSGIAGDGSFTVQVAPGSDVQDALGNPLASSVTSAAVTIDNTPPTISIGAPSVPVTIAGPVSFVVSYGGADSISLAAGDIVLNATGTAAGTVSVEGADPDTRTVTIEAISGEGSLGISIVSGTASDAAGNDAAATGPSATFSVGLTEEIFRDSFE